MSRTTGVVDFPNCMSKLLGFGMSVTDVIACATVNAARTFAVFRDRGTLNVGAPADVAVLELREGEFEFLDNYENKIKGRSACSRARRCSRRARAARLSDGPPAHRVSLAARDARVSRLRARSARAACRSCARRPMFGGVGLYSGERFFGDRRGRRAVLQSRRQQPRRLRSRRQRAIPPRRGPAGLDVVFPRADRGARGPERARPSGPAPRFAPPTPCLNASARHLARQNRRRGAAERNSCAIFGRLAANDA